MSKYFETVNFWLENLLEANGNYTIESNEKRKMIDIVINVSKEDIGKVIGKNGLTANAIRGVMQAAGVKDKLNVNVEFVD